jgi:hypothetical protein
MLRLLLGANHRIDRHRYFECDLLRQLADLIVALLEMQRPLDFVLAARSRFQETF